MAKLFGVAMRLVRGEEAATMVEYALLLALLTAVCIAAMGAVGGAINSLLTRLSEALTRVAT